MLRPSEPVRAQKRQAEVDEEAGGNDETEGEVEHGVPSHPFGGTNAKREGREAAYAQGEVDEVQHVFSPGIPDRTIGEDRVRAPFGNGSRGIKIA
jgi:hypothetical protein